MKANITNLKKALKACAKAHKTPFINWSFDGQLALGSDSIPVYSDVSMICEAFFGAGATRVTPAYGYTTVWLKDSMRRNQREVDTDLLSLALPYGTVL